MNGINTLRVFWAWYTCPVCGSHMGTNANGVESCPDKGCPYHVPDRGAS